MPRLEQMVVPGLALIAGIITAAILYRIGATGAVGAMLVAGFVTMTAAFIETLFSQLAENARTEAAIGKIIKAHDTMRAEAELTRRAVLELKQHMDDSISARNDRVVSEVRVLETLIRRLAESVAERSAEFQPTPEEVLPVRAASRRQAANSQASTRDAMLELIRRALEENRVELYLQPVVSLPQRRVRYYEALSRLRTEDGQIIMPSQYLRVAEPAGLMAVIDNMLLFRCIQALQTWSQRNREVGVFCNLSRETLRDRSFFSQFMEYLENHRELAGLLIFEISQEAFEGMTASESSSLSQLTDLGFTLSIDKVTSLDFDFGAARARRVRYFKVAADLILGDPGQSGARIHPADLKQLLLRYGVNLIVEKIEQEREVLDVLDYNVDYGQGYLFGEPRPIRDVILEHGFPVSPPPRNGQEGRGPRPVSAGRAA